MTSDSARPPASAGAAPGGATHDAAPDGARGAAPGGRRSESPGRLARPLIRLAHLHGVATSYIDQLGAYVENDDAAIAGVLAALGVDASGPEAIEASLRAELDRRGRQLVAPTIVATCGEATSVPVNCAPEDRPRAGIVLEDGTHYDGEPAIVPTDPADAPRHHQLLRAGMALTLPADLPMGYHTLVVEVSGRRATATVICAPKSIPVPPAVAERDRWGWMTQMYSVRSADSWGVGDYGDLRRLLADAGAKSGADFMLINPIHACAPVAPLEPSPYLPESRRFLNVTYIRPQDIPEYAELSEAERAEVDRLHAGVAPMNVSAEPMDINAAWNAKLPALRVIFRHGRGAAREAAFRAFVAEAGEDLTAWATWCVAFETWGAPWEGDWIRTTGRDSAAVRELAAGHAEEMDFQRWLQWIAAEQVGAAQQAAKDSGMALGLMMDMAVGVHALGADVWWSPERFALGGVTVGCPPDFYNQQGQDWGQPPFNPRYLEETGYAVYRDMVHAMFAHAGAIRIDHVLGVFRLWWIPQGLGAKNGAYVRYDHEAMLGVLAIEATRAGGMVIGEDLGTVPDYVRRVLADHGVLGTDVEWFARVDDSPNASDPYKAPSEYRRQALASVTTHDLPPTAGYLRFEHVALRERLGLLSEPVETFAASARAERDAMMARLVESGYLTAEEAADVEGHEQRVVEAMHAMLRDTPSYLKQAALVDGVGERRSQNQPGTSWEYCNWRVPLADGSGHVVPADEVFALPRVRSLAAVMRGER
ncbi:4-alpha-glucanotransferase [Bifidobacterium pullorum subsp. saeculare]|uniref:4-alpha-glucanotransferase n=1 Tax=Bifidobacterium pullorum subsp. saeculare TaxID=78257 RepID=A0A938WY75_9BIFI|nr:4-alpha-glucanotransferase [Bifidobacterium pullorum]MBM6700061.1 4-alpha-glucanotransferase [Bifidobacterium pullorum subsp. saeculare]